MNLSINQQLFEATRDGDSRLVQELLAAGADPNARDLFHGTTPLHDAATTGDMTTAKLLINGGADVNHSDNNVGSTPLGVAAITGNVEMVRLLLSRGARLGKNETEVLNEVQDLGLSEIAAALKEAAKQSPPRQPKGSTDEY